jgi:lysyl-tRNA synthetase class 2
MDLELLRERARIIREVRAFFDLRSYLETDTPLLAPDLIPESCLEVFETRRFSHPGSQTPEDPYWLIPSPEIWMKRLIARHRTSLYQICKCFRNGESLGRMHSPEFTMLEYYTMDADYLGSLDLTEELFRFLLAGKAGQENELSPPFIRLTVEDAFSQWAGFDLYKTVKNDTLKEEAMRLGLSPMSGLSIPELYDLIFIHAVEPKIRGGRPVVLLDYPAFVPCLAKKNTDGKTVQRWELYANGIELANCFSEETNADEVRLFFESERAEKKNALVRHKVDADYWKIFNFKKTNAKKTNTGETCSIRASFPPCSGVAMGLDRLIMLLCGFSTIDAVLPFPMVSTSSF